MPLEDEVVTVAVVEVVASAAVIVVAVEVASVEVTEVASVVVTEVSIAFHSHGKSQNKQEFTLLTINQAAVVAEDVVVPQAVVDGEVAVEAVEALLVAPRVERR